MAKTIVGLYETFDEARKVQDALVNAGFQRSEVGIVAANSDDRYADFVEDNIDETNYNQYYGDRNASATHDEGSAAEGAVAGGVIGAVGTAIVAVLVPGAGPLTATGWILGGLVGLVGGAITGGILGALVDAGVDEEDAVVYSEGIRRGYSLVTVRADDGDAAQVASIMNDHGAIDTEQRAAYWETQGWDREPKEKAPLYSVDEINESRAGYKNYLSGLEEGGSATVPVIEEKLVVGKRQAESGHARVRTYVKSERVEEDVSLRKEHIDVDRHRVDRAVDPSDLDAFEEGVVEVTATSEEAVVGKTARVVEEVTVSKGVEQVSERVGDTVRRTGVDVDYDADAGYDRTVYRKHYDTTYAKAGRTYDYYEPYYQYGYSAAGNAQYTDYSDWTTAEPALRRDYETRYADSDSTWDDVKDAVRSGWTSVKRTVS